MTKIKFFKNNNMFFKIEASGHTGYDVVGKDVLCAYVSSVLQTGALGLKNVLNYKININNKDDGYMLIELNKNQDLSNAQVLFLTMLESIKDLIKGYSRYLKLEVIENDV